MVGTKLLPRFLSSGMGKGVRVYLATFPQNSSESQVKYNKAMKQARRINIERRQSSVYNTTYHVENLVES